MNSYPILGHDSLFLLPMDVAHAKQYADILSEEGTFHFLTESGPVNEDQAFEKIKLNLQSYELGKSIYLSIVGQGDHFLGFIAVHNLKGETVYISYGIHPLQRRKGFASKALKLVLAWEQLADKEIEMAVHLENNPSFKMLSKLELRYLGVKETRNGNRHIFVR